MSDSISVRIMLDSYDFAHPSQKQTQVYVQIPEVARVSYMLPAEQYHGLKDREWPEVLDVAHEHYERAWAVTDSDSAAARAAVRAWLLEDPNRDEMQAAWELDQVRRHPVARTLLSTRTRELVEMEGDRNRWKADAERLRDRVAELEAVFAAERARHIPYEDSPHCRLDGEFWPCPLVAAVDVVQPPGAPTAAELADEAVRRSVDAQFPVVAAFLAEDPQDSPLHHAYRVGRDLPETGGAW